MRTALQQATYELLTDSGGLVLAGNVIPVYDTVPEGTPTPYVTIGEDSLEPDDTDDSRGATALVEISVWTGKEYAGRRTAKLVADLIYERAHQAKPAVAGYTLAAFFWTSSSNVDEVDGITRRLVETFRVFLQE